MSFLNPSKDPGVFDARSLSNGVTIYFKRAEQTFGMPKIACCALLTVGGRDDDRGSEGAAHFFEHMPFRGTKSFPTLSDLTTEIENNGGYVNAFTTDEATGYEVVLPSSLLEKGIERLNDMLLNPVMREEDIEMERNVILEELRNKLGNVNFFARKELYKGLMGDHPLVHAVIGTEEALKSITKERLLDFHSRYYHANNLSLFFAGEFETETLLKLCEQYFGTIPGGEKTVRNIPLPNPAVEAYSQTLTPSHYNRSVYLLGRVMPKMTLREAVLVKLFTDMLVRGMNSPLYEEIREKRGLAYNLGAHCSHYQDLGILAFHVSTQHKHMDEVDRIIWEIVPTILNDQARFDVVKLAIRQAALHHEYTVGALTEDAIDDVLDYNRVITLDEYVVLLESVTLEETRNFVQKFLNKDEFLNIRVNCDREEANLTN